MKPQERAAQIEKDLNEKREYPLEDTSLRYYQPLSEIEVETRRNYSFDVYDTKEGCQKALPNSVPVEHWGSDIELPSYMDVYEYSINERDYAEAMQKIAERYIDTTGEPEVYGVNDEYIILILNPEKYSVEDAVKIVTEAFWDIHMEKDSDTRLQGLINQVSKIWSRNDKTAIRWVAS